MLLHFSFFLVLVVNCCNDYAMKTTCLNMCHLDTRIDELFINRDYCWYKYHHIMHACEHGEVIPEFLRLSYPIMAIKSELYKLTCRS